MRYNLHKIMVIWIGGEVVGCVRVARPTYAPGPQQTAYLVLFLDPQYSTNDEVLQMVFEQIDHVRRYVKNGKQFKWLIMSKYMPPMKELSYGLAVSTGQQFGSTRRKPSSSVLIDEKTGLPLF